MSRQTQGQVVDAIGAHFRVSPDQGARIGSNWRKIQAKARQLAPNREGTPCCCTCPPGRRSRPFWPVRPPSSFPSARNEQHGPTGLLVQTGLSEIIAHEAQKSADILVAPTFNIGMASTIWISRHDRASPLHLHGGDRRLDPLAGPPRFHPPLLPERPRRATSPASRRPFPSFTPRQASPGAARVSPAA